MPELPWMLRTRIWLDEGSTEGRHALDQCVRPCLVKAAFHVRLIPKLASDNYIVSFGSFCALCSWDAFKGHRLETEGLAATFLGSAHFALF
mmetsp:Transcript_2511/g.5159  ORF Transcript_2511/g.5159 Transcript_2511/m.5159 type:complete len:91 (+) Transcript_2511:137-409(+)